MADEYDTAPDWTARAARALPYLLRADKADAERLLTLELSAAFDRGAIVGIRQCRRELGWLTSPCDAPAAPGKEAESESRG